MLTPETIRNLLKTCIEWNCTLSVSASSGTLRIQYQIPKAEITDLPLRADLVFNVWDEKDDEWAAMQRKAIEDLYLEKRSRK